MWTVDDNGPADFQTMQEAINAASPGDTVLVHDGIYYEHILIDKSVLLYGTNRSTTIIDGNDANVVVVNVTANNVVVKGFTVRNGRSGIVISASRNCTVEGNLVKDNGYQGIFVSKSQNCTVSGNYAAGTRGGYGINVFTSENVIVKENAASGNFFDGIGLLDSNNSIIAGNTVNDNHHFGIWVDSSNNNAFYHNNSFNNSKHVSSNTPTNAWDNGIEGNYWSNYTGLDENRNGVGDEPYIVDKQTLQRDRFPLIRPHINEVYLSVDTESPIASFTYSPNVIFVNETVSFDASESDDSVGKNAILNYSWDFGDGLTGTGEFVDHRYLDSGNHTVTLTLTDAAGNKGNCSAVVQVRAMRSDGFPVWAIGVLVVFVLAAVIGVAVVGWKKHESDH